MIYFFCEGGITLRSTILQIGPEQTRKLHRGPLVPSDGDEDEAAVDAPLPKLPKPWIAGAVHEAVGKSSAPPPKRLLPPPPSPLRRSEANTSGRPKSRSAAPRSGRGVDGAEEIHRFPDSGKSSARRAASKEHRRRRGTAPTPKPAPTAPPPPSRRQPDNPHTLPYVHTVRRASPTLPPPRQQTEREEPTPQRRRG